MLIVRKGPTSHLPLHDDDTRQTPDRQTPDTIEIPPTEILDRIFNVGLGAPHRHYGRVPKYRGVHEVTGQRAGPTASRDG